MSINTSQAAQGISYANHAANAFQTAVDIDNQQPHAEGTTFWFRWLIRIVAVVTGIRKSIDWCLTKSCNDLHLVAMICGVIAALSTHATCIAGGAIMM
jgi:hypothetical protein